MPSSAVLTVEVEPRRTAVIAQTTTWAEYPALWPKLLDEVYTFVRGDPEIAAANPRWQNVMLYKDDQPSVEVGVLVAAPFQGNARVIESTLPGCRVAMAVHVGDYAQLGATHEALIAFTDAHQLERAGPRWEIYGHWHEDPAQLETEIYYLLR
jgi:effector-binding domain-containing protein